VSFVVWPQGTARVARGKGTKIGVGTVPEGRRSRGKVYGEGTWKGVAGRLVGRIPTSRPPGVRRWSASQSAAKTAE
jgi:hypothetical protein